MIDLKAYDPAPEVLACVPAQICEELGIIPVSRAGSSLIVAVEDPTNQQVLETLAKHTGLTIEPVIATRVEILAKVAQCYRHRDN